MFRCQPPLAAEGASHVGNHNPNLVQLPVQQLGQLLPGPMWILRGAPEGEQICVLRELGDTTPRFDRRGHQAGNREAATDHPVS